MVRVSTAVAAAAIPAAAVAETVLGAYIFSRHGDRTAKRTGPTLLTGLGYNEIYQSGGYFNSRYIASGSPQQILGISTPVVNVQQISVTAPVDNVLDSSALGFLQGLYPPAGANGPVDTLRNGSTFTNPLNGYNLIPVVTTASGARSEDNVWLQNSIACTNAQASSMQYFQSDEAVNLQSSTLSFYQNLYPVVNRTFASSEMSYKNAYAIYDVINVALIQNATNTIQSYNLISSQDVQKQLLYLANAHEFGLAYNSSSEIRAIAGKLLGAEIVDGLNQTITSGGARKLNIQFGAYGTFLSFFGLAGLAGNVNGDNFYGIPDYASSMTFELYTDDTVTTFPSTTDSLRVRFLFNNGTDNASNAPTNYPLFGQSSTSLSWTDFVTGIGRFSVTTAQQFCQVCGNSNC